MRIYVTYALTLISSFAIYWMFGVMSTVAAGFTWVPFSSFLASILQFGIGSWLFLHALRIGKIIAIAIAMILCIWPFVALIELLKQFEVMTLLFYLTPVLFSAIIIFNHIKTFKQSKKPPFSTRIILSIIPFGLFIA